MPKDTAIMPKDTAEALGAKAAKCESRSLFLYRFADPAAKDTGNDQPRREWFNALLNKEPAFHFGNSRNIWVADSSTGPQAQLLYAQLQSRLMVNMAGGVMENAGLCLDRFGLPYIPGSAVKGCARRTALAALREWCEMGQQPGATEGDQDNAFKVVCAPFATPADMLAEIARIFGWSSQDWSDRRMEGRFISDFAWAGSGASTGSSAFTQDKVQQLEATGTPDPKAAAQSWPILRDTVARKLACDLRISIPADESAPWKRLPNFAGSVAFLPAYPEDLGNAERESEVPGLPIPKAPKLGKLELDVLTCHHRDYYAGDAPGDMATDTEEPVPVVFPTVAPGHVFAFALAPLRQANESLVAQARAWLKAGLQTFGLGAKTNAGYGWFDASEDLQKIVKELVQSQLQKWRERQEQLALDRQNAREEAAREQAEKERLAAAPPHEQAQAMYVKLDDEPFAAQAKKYAEMNEIQRHGFVLALKQRRETAKRWAKKKPELLKPWQDHAQTLQPPIQLP